MAAISARNTIDATEVSTDFLGHCYYAESTSIIADMFSLFRERKRPEDRKTLRAVDGAPSQSITLVC